MQLFWKIYAFVYLGLGLLSLLYHDPFTPVVITDIALSVVSLVMVFLYAFRRQVGNFLVWKVLAVAFLAVDIYLNVYYSPLHNNTTLLGADWWVTVILIAIFVGPAYYAVAAYAWGKLPAPKPKHTPVHHDEAKPEPDVKPKPKRSWRKHLTVRSVILHPLLGYGAILLVAVMAATGWVLVNGVDESLALLDAEPLYAMSILGTIYIWVLAATIGVFIWTHAKRRFRGMAYAMLAVTLLASGAMYWVQTGFNRSYLPRSAYKNIDPKFQLDPRLEQMASDTGLNVNNLKRTKAEIGIPTGLAQGCGHADGTVGCYVNGVIYFYPDNFDYDITEQRATLAHEYLHWVWATSTATERENMASWVNIAYGQNKAWFDDRLITEDSQPGTPEFTDELQATMGSEVDRKLLPPALADYFNHWVPKTEGLPNEQMKLAR